jgi:putative FmdB family regulatory protein
MPIISYKCNKCGTSFDNLQSNSDIVLITCPNDGEPMQKQFTVPAFCFKNGVGTDGGSMMSIPGVIRTPI